MYMYMFLITRCRVIRDNCLFMAFHPQKYQMYYASDSNKYI